MTQRTSLQRRTASSAIWAATALAPALLIAAPALSHDVSEGQGRTLGTDSHLEYLQVGALHMLTGYGHLLFLFGVMFFLKSLCDVVKVITAFTLGDSITLLGATLLGVRANPYLIDAVITVSVISKGFDNLDGFRKSIGVRTRDLLTMMFTFGLVHGFGLSTRIQHLPLPERGLVTHILAFNAGVELGQITALTTTAWGLALVRKDANDFGPLSRVANGGPVIRGGLLLLFQLHGYLRTSDPEAFGFARGEHVHYHDDIDCFDRGIGDVLAPQQ